MTIETNHTLFFWLFASLSMVLFGEVIFYIYFVVATQSKNIDNANCAYFVIESTPIPLYSCQQSEYTKSVSYFCENNNMILRNEWNNPNCDGNINQTSILNSSSIQEIHNCYNKNPQSQCNLANLDIYKINSYCSYSAYYKLLYVVDVCINIDNQYSKYFGCNDKGVITQYIYPLNNINCSGQPLIIANETNSDDSISENDNNNIYIKMVCHNQTYTSYNDDIPSCTKNINSDSYWNNTNIEEVTFIIAAATVLILFWGCYFYRKCCRVTKDQIDEEINDNQHIENKSVGNKGKNKYNELVEEEQVEQEEQVEENQDVKVVENTIVDNKTVKLLQEIDTEIV